jgi:hypothetical protein
MPLQPAGQVRTERENGGKLEWQSRVGVVNLPAAHDHDHHRHGVNPVRDPHDQRVNGRGATTTRGRIVCGVDRNGHWRILTSAEVDRGLGREKPAVLMPK